MRVNRRNVLLGLGTLVTAGGGALATGAFSQVEADRTIDVGTTGDSSAYLQFNNIDSTYVSTSTGDNSNQFELQLGSLNEDAVSKFNSIFDIGVDAPDPNSSDTVSSPYYVYIQSGDNLGKDALLDIQDSSGGTLVDSGNAHTIDYTNGSWGSIQDIGVVVDSINNDTSTAGVSYPSSITFVIQDTDPNA